EIRIADVERSSRTRSVGIDVIDLLAGCIGHSSNRAAIVLPEMDHVAGLRLCKLLEARVMPARQERLRVQLKGESRSERRIHSCVDRERLLLESAKHVALAAKSADRIRVGE